MRDCLGMPHLRSLSLAELTIDDESSFRHVGLYRELKDAMAKAGVPFLSPQPGSALERYESVLLLNLAFWNPGDVVEVLVDDRIAADQLAHGAWHKLAHVALGEGARSSDGLLLAESIASAFDVYLVGRLIGHAPESGFLETQVPAMRDAAEAAGLDDDAFERLIERMVSEPEASFESLRQLLFDTATALVAASDLESAAAVLADAATHPMGPLLHHYELPSWVLHARAYGHPVGPCAEVRAIDRELRAAPDALAWLERAWLG
jgi:hypothetical protein